MRGAVDGKEGGSPVKKRSHETSSAGAAAAKNFSSVGRWFDSGRAFDSWKKKKTLFSGEVAGSIQAMTLRGRKSARKKTMRASSRQR